MATMEKLRRMVERSDTKAGRAFDWTVQTLVLVSLVSFSVETLPNLPFAWQRFLSAVEAVTVGLFTVEYLLRVLVAEKKSSYILSFFGLVDLIAIVPFYLPTGLDLRAVRAVRFMRVFSAFEVGPLRAGHGENEACLCYGAGRGGAFFAGSFDFPLPFGGGHLFLRA